MRAFNFLVLVSIISLLGCEDFPLEKDYPVVLTKTATFPTDTSVLFSADLKFTNNHSIVDYGFFWKRGGMLNSYKISLYNPSEIIPQKFEYILDSDMIENSSDYYQGYVETGNLLIKGEKIMFNSPGSAPFFISDFSPKTGLDLTIVSMTGNFGTFEGSNRVRVGPFFRPILYSSQDSLVFTIPVSTTVGDFSISILDKTNKIIAADENFTVKNISITSLSSTTAFPGDRITIFGEFIASEIIIGNKAVLIGNKNAGIVAFSSSMIEVFVPDVDFGSSSEIIAEVRVLDGLKFATFPLVVKKP